MVLDFFIKPFVLYLFSLKSVRVEEKSGGTAVVFGPGPARGIGIALRPRQIVRTALRFTVPKNARTGEDFHFDLVQRGEDGRIDLTQGLRRPVDRLHYGVTSPPVICRDMIMVGSSIVDAAVAEEMPPGDVRAFDARTGEHVWTFESIPQGEVAGGQTWGDLSWKTFGNTNVWSYMSCDEELGLVYLPFTTPP